MNIRANNWVHISIWILVGIPVCALGFALLFNQQAMSASGVEHRVSMLVRPANNHEQNAFLLSGPYTGTVAINEPLALGILDISLILTDTNGVLSGLLNHSGTLAFPSATSLQGSITSSAGAITPTFRIDTAPFTSLVSGRQVTRSFRMEGEIREGGDVLAGTYRETIRGFTPDALVVNGSFLLSRPRHTAGAVTPGPLTPTPTVTPPPGVATPTATPTPPGTGAGSERVLLPLINR